jgi:hypothetical protein
MNRLAQAKARQDLVVGTIGGTRLAGNLRNSDTLEALLECLRDVAALGPRDRNLSSTAADMIAELAEDFPRAITAEGRLTEDVAVELSATVEDVDALMVLDALEARDAAWQALEDLCASADCIVEGEDGLAVFPYDAEREYY